MRNLHILHERELRCAGKRCTVEQYLQAMFAAAHLRRNELQPVAGRHFEGERMIADSSTDLAGSGLRDIKADLVRRM